MLGELVLESRYMFVTTKEQAIELLDLLEKKPESLNGMLILMDSNLVVAKKHSTKISVALTYFIVRSRKLNSAVLIVKNPESSLDGRIRFQVTHKAMITAKELIQRTKRL